MSGSRRPCSNCHRPLLCSPSIHQTLTRQGGHCRPARPWAHAARASEGGAERDTLRKLPVPAIPPARFPPPPPPPPPPTPRSGYLRRQLLLLAGGAIAASTVGYSLVGSGILEGRPVSEDDASSLKQLEAYFERGVRLVDPRGEAQLELVAPSARDEYYVRLDPSRPDRLLLKPKGGAGVYYLDIAVPVNAQVLLEVFQKPPSVFEKAEWEQRLRPLTPQQLPSQEWPLIPGQPPRTVQSSSPAQPSSISAVQSSSPGQPSSSSRQLPPGWSLLGLD